MRLVLCDDNRIFCEALAVALEARGHQALAIATTADEGVAAVARHQPDACLLDFRFHEGGDGVGAAREIRDKSPGTAVLVVSDSGSRVASLAATEAGVAGFVGKDSELDRIATALDAIAAGWCSLSLRPAPAGTTSHRAGRSPPEPGSARDSRAASDTRDARYQFPPLSPEKSRTHVATHRHIDSPAPTRFRRAEATRKELNNVWD